MYKIILFLNELAYKIGFIVGYLIIGPLYIIFGGKIDE